MKFEIHLADNVKRVCLVPENDSDRKLLELISEHDENKILFSRENANAYTVRADQPIQKLSFMLKEKVENELCPKS